MKLVKHDYKIYSALRHAIDDRSGHLLANLVCAAQQHSPLISIRHPKGHIVHRQADINEVLGDYYSALYMGIIILSESTLPPLS